MFPALSTFALLLLVLPHLASIASADDVRLSLVQLTSIEPREWNVDKLWARFEYLTHNQNITKPSMGLPLGNWQRGAQAAYTNAYQDFPIADNEPYLALSLAVYNAGDKDPQKIGLGESTPSMCQI